MVCASGASGRQSANAGDAMRRSFETVARPQSAFATPSYPHGDRARVSIDAAKEEPEWRPGGVGGKGFVEVNTAWLRTKTTSAALVPYVDRSPVQMELAAALEDAKDELYAVFDVVEERTEKVRVAEAERRVIYERYTERERQLDAELATERAALEHARAEVAARDSKIAAARARAARADADVSRLEGELRQEHGAIRATRESYDHRLEGLVQVNADFERRLQRLDDAVTGARDQARHMKRRILETKRLITATLTAPREEKLSEPPINTSTATKAERRLHARAARAREKAAGAASASTDGASGKIRTGVHLPPMPGETFELSMQLDDLTARLDDDDRRVQCRELHERGLEPKLRDLTRVFRHYCAPRGAWIGRLEKATADAAAAVKRDAELARETSTVRVAVRSAAARVAAYRAGVEEADADPTMEMSGDEDGEGLDDVALLNIRGEARERDGDEDDDTPDGHPFLLSGAGLRLMLIESGLVDTGVSRDMTTWVLRQVGRAADLDLDLAGDDVASDAGGLTLDEWLEFLVRCGFYLAAEAIRRAHSASHVAIRGPNRTGSPTEEFRATEAAAASMVEAEAQVLTPGGERRLVNVAALALDPVLNRARREPPPPEGFELALSGSETQGVLDRHRTHLASVFAAVASGPGRASGGSYQHGGFGGGSKGSGRLGSGGFGSGGVRGAGGVAGRLAPPPGASSQDLLGREGWLDVVRRCRVVEAGFVSTARAVDIFVELAYADLCDRTSPGGGWGGAGGNLEGMEDGAAAVMASGSFAAVNASTAFGASEGVGIHRIARNPGRGSRAFAQRDSNAGALRMARFEAAVARVAWEHYEGAAAAAVAAMSMDVVTTDDSLIAKGREVLASRQPRATLAARLEAFIAAFFVPNLRRIADG